jgi:hypothetical protein
VRNAFPDANRSRLLRAILIRSSARPYPICWQERILPVSDHMIPDPLAASGGGVNLGRLHRGVGGGLVVFSASSETTGTRAETALIQALRPVRTKLHGISNRSLAPRHGVIRMAPDSRFYSEELR